MRWRSVSVAVLGLSLLVALARLQGERLVLEYVVLHYQQIGLSRDAAVRDFLYTVWEERAPSGLFRRELEERRARLLAPAADAPVPGEDHATAVCKASLYTQLTSEELQVPSATFEVEGADSGSERSRRESYLRACREVFASLDQGDALRKALAAVVPRIAENVTTPTLLTSGSEERQRARAEREHLATALDQGTGPGRPAGAPLKPLAELGAEGALYELHGLRPALEPTIRVGEIAEAVRSGRVARFDATVVLPPELFKLSMLDLERLHDDVADVVPMYRQRSTLAPNRTGWESLRDYASRLRKLNASQPLTVPLNRPWRPTASSNEERAVMQRLFEPPTWWLRWLATAVSALVGTNAFWAFPTMQQKALQTAINVRRLPRLPLPPGGMEQVLGNPPWLERVQSLLWTGPTLDCWHYDEVDNLIIAVRGEIHVTVYEPQYTELLRARGGRGCWSGSDNLPRKFTDPAVLAANPWLRRVPFYTLRLHPGQGIVIPSMAYHSLASPDSDRLMLNAFLIPRFGELWDAPAAIHSFYRRSLQSKEYAALRQLKFKALARLWETQRLGGWFEAAKLEML